ncbi:BMC domain-containing protein [Pelosinus sp. IPA-1]|uniref:BMC domain-containing protein n=1 Tax=Pelosinus sp. IPA-1 TaxID=3029569 RepID=UPI0024362922|nr:BMC domain-containing protein [Pelosinus sp. IPA-1]GMA97620.1 propanediol utilization protein PduK [Pelosinus sp. IPA-1]
MVKDAVGLIEIVGLAAALEAADAAVKAANVELIGYELTKGGGLVVVKLSGNVGAVKAAIEAGKMAGSKVNKVWATHIIPRPHGELSCMLLTKETVGLAKKQPVAEVIEPAKAKQSETLLVSNEVEVEVEASIETESQLVKGELEEHESETNKLPPVLEKQKKVSDYCNLCGDPACPRIKGDPKITCIHYERNNKEAE